MSKRVTHKELITNALKKDWLSNYQVQQLVKSSSGDRTLRTIRENPPEGYVMEQRLKSIPGYAKCFEYRLVPISS